MFNRNPASIFITEFPNCLRLYIALYRHWPPPYFSKYAIAVVLSDFILTCLEPFQDLQYLFKAKKTVLWLSKKLMWLCSFVIPLSPIEKHSSVAPQPNSLASVYIVKSVLGRWMCLQALGMCWSHQCNFWTAEELIAPALNCNSLDGASMV